MTPPKAPEIRVKGNRPRLLEAGAPPPPIEATSPTSSHLQPVVPAGPYWTPDKAAKFVAQGMKSLSKLYGPDMRLSEVEVDLLGPPAAAVMNDWMPLKPGEDGDKQANLVYLVVVVGLIVLFRLPDILEAHDMLPAWALKNRERGTRRPAERDTSRPPAAPAAPAAAAEPLTDQAESGDRWDKFNPRLVGGQDFARPEPV